MAQNENLAAQVVNAVSQQTELAQNMCKSVLQNQSILNFFDKEYSSSSDLLYYRTTIYEFVKTTNGMSDIKLRVYLENDSIPMGFGVFYPVYRDSRQNDTEGQQDKPEKGSQKFGKQTVFDEDIGRLVLNQQLRLNDADGCLAGQVPVAHDPVELCLSPSWRLSMKTSAGISPWTKPPPISP